MINYLTILLKTQLFDGQHMVKKNAVHEYPSRGLFIISQRYRPLNTFSIALFLTPITNPFLLLLRSYLI